MSKRIWLRTAVLGASVAAASAGLTAGAVDAQATPFGCHASAINSYSAHAWCTGGTGYVRVRFTCMDGILGFTYQVTGPWVAVPNQYSTASCTSPQRQSIVSGTVTYDTDPAT